MIEIYSQEIEQTWFCVAVNNHCIVTSSFAENQQAAIYKVLDKIPFKVPFQIFHEPTIQAKTILAALKDLHNGKTAQADLHLVTSNLTDYTKKVLKATQCIPIGYVTSYGEIAKAAGGGARAVGNIMASNPFAPIVPCHRVVKSDFSLGGYGLGLKFKVELLKKEKQGFSCTKQVNVDGVKLGVFPVEWVLRNLV
jgi:O-6-methylguanine DNA methyltransferase